MSDYWIDKDPDSKSYNKWMIGNKSTGIDARGLPGVTPHIGPNGNWFIGDWDTGVLAEGQNPYIGENGHWWVGDTDTGISAEPAELAPESDTDLFE